MLYHRKLLLFYAISQRSHNLYTRHNYYLGMKSSKSSTNSVTDHHSACSIPYRFTSRSARRRQERDHPPAIPYPEPRAGAKPRNLLLFGALTPPVLHPERQQSLTFMNYDVYWVSLVLQDQKNRSRVTLSPFICMWAEKKHFGSLKVSHSVPF